MPARLEGIITVRADQPTVRARLYDPAVQPRATRLGTAVAYSVGAAFGSVAGLVGHRPAGAAARRVADRFVANVPARCVAAGITS